MKTVQIFTLFLLLLISNIIFSQSEELCEENLMNTFPEFDHSNGEIMGGSATNAPEMRFTGVTTNDEGILIDLVIKRDNGNFVMDTDGNSDCTAGFALNDTNPGDMATFCFVESGTNTPVVGNAAFFLDDFDAPEGFSVTNVGLTNFAAQQSNLGVTENGTTTDFQSNDNNQDAFVMFFEDISSLTITFTNPVNQNRDFCFASSLEEIFTFFDCTTLPITLSDFSLEINGDDVIVNWRTESEIDNDFFEIEHSIDGIHFEPVAKINGAGNSSDPINYTHTLFNVLSEYPEGLFYRLKQTDFDGTTSYSSVEFTGSNVAFQSKSIKLFPNPASDIMTITYPSIRAVKIYTTTGQLAKETNYDARESVTLDVSGLEPGLYIIDVNSEIRTKVYIK